MFTSVLNYHDEIMFLVRLVVGFIFVYHGIPKLRKPEGMAAGMGWPKGVVTLVGLVEVLGGLGIALGILLQLSALGLVIVMIGAIWMKITKWKTPFTTMTGTGWEYDLILLVVLLLIMAHGTNEYTLMM